MLYLEHFSIFKAQKYSSKINLLSNPDFGLYKKKKKKNTSLPQIYDTFASEHFITPNANLNILRDQKQINMYKIMNRSFAKT